METTASININNELIINGLRSVGKVYTVCPNGQRKSAAPTKNSTTLLYPNGMSQADAETLGMVKSFDFPVYVSTSPSDHHVNPKLIAEVA